MIRGWKLNPMWRMYYENKRRERALAAYVRQQIEQQVMMAATGQGEPLPGFETETVSGPPRAH